MNHAPGFGLEGPNSYSLMNLHSRPWEQLREEAGLERGAVAEQVGLEVPELAAIEQETSAPSPRVRAALLNLYAPTEPDKITVETPHILYQVTYLRGEYNYEAIDRSNGTKYPVSSDRIRRQLRRAMSRGPVHQEVEEVLSRNPKQFAST